MKYYKIFRLENDSLFNKDKERDLSEMRFKYDSERQENLITCPENMPILSDLHQALLDQHLPEADRVAQALDLYVSGSLNVFNHKTNVDIHNRLVAFDIKELGKQLKKLGMLIIQDQIWGRVTQNRSQGRATWYFADEFHLLLKEEQTAAYSAEIWKRFRKWGGVPTVIGYIFSKMQVSFFINI